jgi:hypothetical protein
MRSVDDPLVEVVGPGMGAGRAQSQPHAGDELEEAGAALALQRHRFGKILGPAGADLDLRGDQLSGGRLGQDLVLEAGRVDVLVAMLQLQGGRIEDRKLLLEADREVGGGLESLANGVEVEGHVVQAR